MSTIREIAESAQPIAAAETPATEKKKKPAKKKTSSSSQPDAVQLPEDCPVVPLGINGDTYYYIDASRQLREISAEKHSRLGLLALFNQRSEYLWNTWPRQNDQGAVTGWRPELVAEALMGACAREGLLDVDNRVRGPGAWADDDGQLVLHCGDVIYDGADAGNPGRIGRYIYHAAPPIPHPYQGKTDTAAADELRMLFCTWEWARPQVDPFLLLGWIGASMIGGALKWRPMVWITGDRGTGKSTLQEVINHLHGDGLLQVADPTAAGLWQRAKRASLPIAIDELEPEGDSRKNANIIKLARLAASGASMVRGGSDHKGTTFTVRSCFLFSSVLIPPMQPAEISRMAILSLNELRADAKPPHLEPKKLAEISAIFRKRMMEQWPRLADTLDAYRGALQAAGHTSRGADQFGTLLACMDLLLYDDIPSANALAGWGEKLKWSTLAEAENATSDSERCISHLLSSICDTYKDGKRRTVGSWIEQAADRWKGADFTEADKVLGAMGIRVQRPRVHGQPTELLIANAHQGLAHIYRDTVWASLPGSSGVWVQSIRRVPGAEASKSSTNFGGAPSRYTRLPLDAILPPNGKEGAE